MGMPAPKGSGITCLLCCDVFVDKCDIKKFRRKKKPHFLKVF